MMEMINNMIDMLADVPPLLASAWAAWFLVGGGLAFWYRRATEFEYAPVAAPKPVQRPRPATRPPSGVRREAAPAVEPAAAPHDDTSHPYEPPPVAPVMAREKTPVVIGDPFGDLATLLDQPPAAAPAAHRAPADSPILSAAGSPIRRNNEYEPKLG